MNEKTSINPERIPAVIREAPQWLVWRYKMRKGKLDKPPINPHDTTQYGDSTDPAKWTSFTHAATVAATDKTINGIGFALSAKDDYIGIDVDGCRDPESGELRPWAQSIMAEFHGTYAEVSPSQTGIKIFARWQGKLPRGYKVGVPGESNPAKNPEVEIYESGRYFTVTGEAVNGATDVVDCTDAVNRLLEKLERWKKENAENKQREKLNDKKGTEKTPDLNDAGKSHNTTGRNPIDRARKYIEKMPEAIDGKGGSNAALSVACTLYRFGLSDTEARQLFDEYNARCVPPWSEREIEHKLESAREKVEKAGEFGSMLRSKFASKMSHADYITATDTCLELLASESRTDTANGRRLVARCGNLIRYVSTWQKWLVWDGKRWRPDDGPAIEALAKLVADFLWVLNKALQEQAETDEEIEKMLGTVAGFCRSSSSRNGIGNMIALARSEPGIAVTHNELDTDGWLLNVQNGVLDLRSGTLMPHDPVRLITKLAPVEYNPTAECPLWRSTITTAMDDDTELIEFQRRSLGMALTGVVRDHVLPFWHGDGANGKSTIVEAMLALLGDDYSMKAPEGLLIAKDHDSHPTERADLFGKRLVICNETQQGRRLNESLIKDLTGGDTISARRMREDFWRFRPTHKIIMFGNHKPAVRGTDNGIWRRLKLVPFNVVIAPEDQDPELPAKLLGELSGILNWCFIGCLEWQRKGLNPPVAVEAATAEYRTEQDTLGEFISDCCIVDPSAKAKGSDIYGAFRWWMKKTRGEKPWSAKAFSQEITHRFDRHRNNGTWYLGIGVVSQWHETEQETDTTDSTDTFSG